MSRLETCWASRVRLGVALVAAAVLALVVLGPASARTQLGSKYGGTLVVGLGRSGDPVTLDPTVSRNPGATEVFLTMCLTLYETNSMLQTVPVLAAALPVPSKDKLSYTIQLRQGVQFNDGTPFNAQAVVTSYQRYVTYPGSSHASDFESVESVTASGPYTVVYHLRARDSAFTGNMYVLSPTQLARLGDNFGANPICVGPFMFDHRVVGDNTTVVKSPYYYDRQHVYLDKIVFKPMTDAPAAAAALKAGDIQVLDQVSSTELQGVRQSTSLRVIQAPSLGWQGIVINLGNKNGVGQPYANVGTPLARSAKLRQAFEEAIDRNTLNRVVFGGLNQPSCTMIAPSNTAWYDATKVPCTSYDPRDAKKLVTASGISNPTVHLVTPNTTDRLRVAQFIQAQEAAVGINVVIDSVDPSTDAAWRLSGDFEASLFGFAGNIDPSGVIYKFLATSGESNYSGYSNPRLDLILSNGLKATNRNARSTLYRVAQQIIAGDRPIVVFYNGEFFAGFNANVSGVQMTGPGHVSVADAQFR
jgi:peptide/nickel transport system substrate-binding protein